MILCLVLTLDHGLKSGVKVFGSGGILLCSGDLHLLGICRAITAISLLSDGRIAALGCTLCAATTRSGCCTAIATIGEKLQIEQDAVEFVLHVTSFLPVGGRDLIGYRSL